MPCRVSHHGDRHRLFGPVRHRRAQSLLAAASQSRRGLGDGRLLPSYTGQSDRQGCEYKSPQSHANVQDQRGPLLLAAAFHRIVDEPECDWLAESLVLDFRRDVELLAVG